MKKEVFFILLVVIFLIAIHLAKAENNTITGSVVTGDITNVLVLNITVSGPPTLTLLSPKNFTYITSQNLRLNFTVSDQETITYSIDSNPNITITGNIKFNTTEGNHSLFLYANNSQGTTSRNVTFFVNSTKFQIKYNNYSNSHKGASTDFNASSYEDMQNLTGVILEHTNFGKINFNNNIINLTDDSDFSDNQIDIDGNTNFSFNRIEINSSAIGNFNKSATLTLYNLTFTTPRILRDGSVCSSAICTEGSYSSGTFFFNVTSFSTYTTEETPVAETPSTPSTSSGGGGGGGGITLLPIVSAFDLSDEQISVSLSPGQIESRKFTITNNRNQQMKFEIKNTILDFLIIQENSFSLAPLESKTISLDFIARENAIPNLYLGKIIVSAGGETKEVLVAVEVETGGALLDVQAEIPEGYQKVLPGENVLAEIKMFNLGIKGRADVLIEYEIRNFNDETILTQQESIAIETQTSFMKTFTIPENAEYGDYVLYV